MLSRPEGYEATQCHTLDALWRKPRTHPRLCRGIDPLPPALDPPFQPVRHRRHHLSPQVRQTQVDQYENNELGNTTKHTDTLGRIRKWQYDATGIDVLSVKQQNGATDETLVTFTYHVLNPKLLSNEISKFTITASPC
jgi:hypothetical protein